MSVVLKYGANEVFAEYQGFSVEQVRKELLADAAAAAELNISQEKAKNAVAFLNGGKTQMTESQEKEYRLQEGDKLEFSKEFTKARMISVC